MTRSHKNYNDRAIRTGEKLSNHLISPLKHLTASFLKKQESHFSTIFFEIIMLLLFAGNLVSSSEEQKIVINNELIHLEYSKRENI